MTQNQVIEQLKKLTLRERLLIAEEALRLIHKDLEGVHDTSTEKNQKNQLLTAAKILLSDYESDPELTSFTSLDREDFRAEK